MVTSGALLLADTIIDWGKSLIHVTYFQHKHDHGEKLLLLSPHREKKHVHGPVTQLINGIFLIRHMGREVKCKKWRRKKQNIDFQVLYYDVKMTLEYLTF